MLYSDIIGQREPKQRLIKMVNDDRVPHALMFTGPEGSGNLPAAVAFAQHLLCRTRGSEGPCGNCNTCRQVSRLSYPDLHIVFPIAKSKDIKTSNDLMNEFREAFLNHPYLSLSDWFNTFNAENKQAIIPTDESNDIIRKLNFTSFGGSYKIMIIWHPEKMNAESANKLLKILEEPPEKTIFILVSTQPDQLLPTIISRVQLIRFNKCSEEEIAAGLIAKYRVNEETARQTARLADGSYTEAMRLLTENEESVSFLENFQSFMRIALTLDVQKGIQWIDENAGLGREKQKQFLQYALGVFRDSLMYNYGDKELVKLSGQEKSFIEKFAPFVNQKNYAELVDEFNNDYYYIERNANPKILFMDLLFKTHDLIRRK